MNSPSAVRLVGRDAFCLMWSDECETTNASCCAEKYAPTRAHPDEPTKQEQRRRKKGSVRRRHTPSSCDLLRIQWRHRLRRQAVRRSKRSTP